MKLNEEKFRQTIIAALELSESAYHAELKIGDCAKWDSLGHIELIFALESEFDVRFLSDEIPELKSIPAIKKRLQELL